MKTSEVLRRLGIRQQPRSDPVSRSPAHRTNGEFEHQCALFTWAHNAATLKKYPELKLLEGSLNGVHLTKAQAGKAKAAGMLKGAHDVRLPVARGGFIGCSIEMKYGHNKPTPEQLEYADDITKEGWYVAFCWSWEDARKELENYLSR